LKILSCIEKANINNQLKCHVSTVICFRVTSKPKIDFIENRFNVKKNPGFPLFYMGFPCAFNIYFPNAPTRFTFPSNKKLLKKIEAVMLPQTVMPDKKKRIVKSIHLYTAQNPKPEN